MLISLEFFQTNTTDRHFAVWSCLAVILALGYDPFVQNLVHYQQKMVVDSSKTAFVANSSIYNAYGFQYVLTGSGGRSKQKKHITCGLD